MRRIVLFVAIFLTACAGSATAPPPTPIPPTQAPTATAIPTQALIATPVPTAAPTSTPTGSSEPEVVLITVDNAALLAPTGDIAGPSDTGFTAMSLSLDGLLLAAAGNDGTISVWDGLSGDLIQYIEGKNELHALAFGYTQPVLATADATTITLWDLASEEPRSLWTQEVGERVLALDFQRSGEILAVGMSTEQYLVLDAATGAIRQAAGAISPVSRLVFTPDDAIIVTGGTDGLIRYWNASDGQPLYTGQIGHDAPVTALSVTGDGLLLASGGGDSVVKVYDGYTASWLNTLQGHTGTVQALAFSLDGTLLASGDATGALRVWDVVLSQQVFEAAFAHVDGVTGLAWSPDGSTLYSAGMDGTVTTWRTSSAE